MITPPPLQSFNLIKKQRFYCLYFNSVYFFFLYLNIIFCRVRKYRVLNSGSFLTIRRHFDLPRTFPIWQATNEEFLSNASKSLEIERMKYIHSTDGMNDWDRGFSFTFSFRQTCIHVWLSVYDTLSLQTHAMTPLSQTTSFRRSPLWDVCPYRDSDSCSGWGRDAGWCSPASSPASFHLLALLLSLSLS